MKITVLVPPFQPDARSPTVVGVRAGAAVDEFAAALEQASGTRVAVIEGSMADAPDDGYLILFGPVGLETFPQVARRAILMEAFRGTILEDLETLGLAGAVEISRYVRWRGERDRESGSGVFGLKRVADAIDARIGPPPLSTQRYSTLSTPRARDLPSLIVAYLAALAAIDGPP